jgi:hypothetical protein
MGSLIEAATEKLRLYREGSHAKNFWPVVIGEGIYSIFDGRAVLLVAVATAQ